MMKEVWEHNAWIEADVYMGTHKRHQDGTEEWFDAHGRRARRRYPDGREMGWGYDETGLVELIWNKSGRML